MKPGTFDPVDPTAVSVGFLKNRAGEIMAAEERGEITDMPVAPGWYRCAVCRRVLERGQTYEEARAECVRRFGAEPEPPDVVTVCDDCNRIIADDLGLPL